MSTSDRSSASKVVQIPDKFGFGLEKRSTTIDARKIHYESDEVLCEHKWIKCVKEFQTLTAEGKVVWECNDCKKIHTTYDWEQP